MPILEVNNIGELNDAIKTNGVCVVDFFAHWCGPCISLGKQLHEAYDHNNGVTILKIDVDTQDELLRKFIMDTGVKSMPFIMFFKEGKVQPMTVKGADFRRISAIIEELLEE